MEDKGHLFLQELKELLLKYKCEIALEDFSKGYTRTPKIVVDFDYDQELGTIGQIVLGSYLNGN